ncbi:MAG: hypothetical protein WBV82_21715 [Myxococcaceae bacterium]
MTARRVLALVFILAIVMLERLAYYGVRSVLVLLMTKQLSMSHQDAFGVYQAFTVAIYLLPFLVAPIALASGPRIPLVAGGIVAVVGMALLGFGDASQLQVALALFALGVAGIKVGLYSLAGELVTGLPTSASLGLFSMAYVAINVGAFAAPLVFGTLGATRGFSSSVIAAAGVMFLATLLSAAAAVISNPVKPTDVPRPIGLAGAALYTIAVLPILLLTELSGTVQYDVIQAQQPESMIWFTALNPGTVVLVGGVFAGVMLVLAARRVRVRPEYIFAAGSLLFAAAALPLLLADSSSSGTTPSVDSIVMSTVLGAVGELLVMVAGLARVGTCAPSRFVPFGFAAWFGVALLANRAVGLATDPSTQRLLLWVAMGLTLAAGVGIAALSGLMERSLLKPEREPSPGPSPHPVTT